MILADAKASAEAHGAPDVRSTSDARLSLEGIGRAYVPNEPKGIDWLPCRPPRYSDR